MLYIREVNPYAPSHPYDYDGLGGETDREKREDFTLVDDNLLVDSANDLDLMDTLSLDDMMKVKRWVKDTNTSTIILDPRATDHQHSLGPERVVRNQVILKKK